MVTLSPSTADPDMLASRLAEQEYLQSLGEPVQISLDSTLSLYICFVFFRPSQKCQQTRGPFLPAVGDVWRTVQREVCEEHFYIPLATDNSSPPRHDKRI